MSIKIGTGSSAVEPTQLRLGGLTSPVSRVMVGIGDDAVPAYERAILPLQPMIVGSPTWAYLPDNAEYGKLAEFTVSGKGKGRFKVNVATFSDTQTNNLRRKLELRYNAVTIASWASYDNDFWTVTDSLSDEFDFPEDAKIEVWGELTNDYWENRHYRWWNVEVVPSVVQDPSALIPISLWGGRVRDPDPVFPTVVFNERMRGSGWVDIAATADMGGAFNGDVSSRYIRIRVNGTLMILVRDSYIGRVTQEALVEEVYLEDNDLVTVDISNGSNMDMIMYGWTVDITLVRVEEPVVPAVETTTALTIDPSSVEEGELVTLTATVTPSNAVGSVTFDGAGETSTVSLVNGVATATRTFSAPGEYEVSAEFVPTSEEDFLPSADTTSITVVEGVPVVVIDATGYMGPRDQLRDALTARGLNYETVKTLPFALDTSQATSLEGLFHACYSLTEVPEMDTSNVTNMSYMFNGSSSLTEVPEMDTSNVTNMRNMFYGCYRLAEAPAMDTSNVTNMSFMFMYCDSLTEAPEMDTSNVTNMSRMFSDCIALTYVPDMETSNVTDMGNMFNGCGALTDGNVRLIGRHPDVDTTDMIANSGLTVEPFVIEGQTITDLTITPSSVVVGNPVTLTATITPQEAEGVVEFLVGTQTLTADVVDGVATTTVTPQETGEYDITANFIPDSEDFWPSSDTASVSVTLIVTSTVLTVADEIDIGEVVPMTATVTPSEAVGEVTFTVGTQTSTVALVGGTASSTVTIEDPGLYDIMAEFIPTPGSNFEPSSDTVEVLAVDPDAVQVVKITSTSERGAQDQLHAALAARGLDPLTVEYLPFELDTSGSTNLSNMFNDMSALKEVPEIDTTGVRGMRAMFRNCSSLEQLPDLDMSDVDYMTYMFQGCSSLTEIPDWLDTSKAMNHDRIFAYCSSLTYIPEIDASASTNMYGLFTDCSSLVNAPEMTNTENITRMATMFQRCSSLEHVPDMDTSSVTDMTRMFFNTPSLTDGNVRLFGKHPDVDTTDMIDGSGLTFEPFYTHPVKITGTNWWDSRNQFRDALTAQGLDYQTVETIPFPLDTSEATNLWDLFSGCSELTEVPEMDTSNVTDMWNMFNGCSSLTEVPAMDTSNVTSMWNMFNGCSSLTEAPEMDTSNVTNMSFMFQNCSSLTYVPDMDTSNATNVSRMFSGCEALTDGNVRLFGKHPDVDTSYMISNSGLTREPFFGDYDFTIDLGSGRAERFISNGEVATHVVEGYSGELVLTMTTVWSNPRGSETYRNRMYRNGSQLIDDPVHVTQMVDSTIFTEFVTQVTSGDELSFAVSSTNDTASYRNYDSLIITITELI